MTKWLLTIAALLCASLAPAQAVQPILQPHQHFVDNSGNACAGCSLFSYQAGSTTPQPTYTDASGAVQNTNPVILDAAGGASVWPANGVAYKYVLIDTYGTVLWTVDNVLAPTAGGTALPLTGGTLTGPLFAPEFQFSGTTANLCPSGQYVTGWNASGWVCSAIAVPNALTAAASGGAAPGTTFNGSAAVTLDYHSFGAQGALTLTTTGTSGASTLTGNTLNIPNYTAATAFISSLTTTGTSGAATVTGGVLNIPVYASSGIDKYWTSAGCAFSADTNGQSCTLAMTIPAGGFADSTYTVFCQPYQNNSTNNSLGYAMVKNGTRTATGFTLVLVEDWGDNAGAGNSWPEVDCHAHHN